MLSPWEDREKEQQKCIDGCFGTDAELVQSLWVRIIKQTNDGSVVVGVYCRLPDKEEMNEVFFRKLKESSYLQLSMGNLKEVSA